MTEYRVTSTFDRPNDGVLCKFINEAVTLAQDGDVITVDPGTYDENVVIMKSITLQGRGARDETILHGTVKIGASGAIVRRLTLDHPEPLKKEIWGRGEAILVRDVERVIISDCMVRGWNPAIEFTRLKQCRIEGCLLQFNIDYGIFLNQCEDCAVVGNRFEGDSWFGLRLSWSKNNLVEGNHFTDSGWISVLVDRDSSTNTITRNLIDGSNVGIALCSGGNTIGDNRLDLCNHGILVGTTVFDREEVGRHDAPKTWQAAYSDNTGNIVRGNAFHESKREHIITRGAKATVIEDNQFSNAAYHDIVVLDGGDQCIGENHSDSAMRLCDVAKAATKPSKQPGVLWGEMHMHTDRSDGGGTIVEGLTYGRDVLGLDFVGSADHAEHMARDTEHDRWQEVREACESFNKPGKFLAIPGFELTYPNHWWSHLNIYYAGFDGQFLSSNEPGEGGVPKIIPVDDNLQKVRNSITRSLVMRHHFMNAPQYWDRTPNDPELIVGTDICSIHANWEKDGDYYRNAPWAHPVGTVRQGLQRGFRFAVMAGSDSHFAFPGDYALTAVMTEDHTINGLFDAFAARRTYATTGERIEIDFSVDGRAIGEAYTAGKTPLIQASVKGTADLKVVQIVRDNCVVYSVPGRGDSMKLEWEDPDWQGHSFYYLRVVQRDYGKAWTTPVWING